MANSVEIELTAIARDLKGLRDVVSELKGVQKSAADAQKGINKLGDSLSSGFGAATLALGQVGIALAALRTIGNILAGPINEAIEAEKSFKQLEAALESTGSASRENLQGFSDLAEEIQRTTRFNDDLVISQLAVAKNFGLSDNAAKQLIVDATDLAAVTGKDLPEAVTALLQALNGQGRALKLLGPQFASLTEEQLKSAGAQDLIRSKFGNRAEKDILTTAGALEQLKNSYNNASESIGVFLVNSLKLPAVFNGIAGALNSLSSSKTPLQEITSEVENLEKQLEQLRKTTPSLVGTIQNELNKAKIELKVQLAAESDQEITDQIRKIRESNIVKSNSVITFAVETEGLTKAIKDLEKVGLSAREIAVREKTERLRILNEAVKAEENGGKLEVSRLVQVSLAKLAIEKDYQNKVEALNKKAQEDRKKEAAEALRIFNDAKNNLAEGFAKGIGKNGDSRALAGAATGLAQQSISSRSAGAALGVGASLGANAIAPGSGEIVGPLIQELAKGKEAAKAFVTEFLNSIPDLVLGLIEGIGAAATAFLDGVPLILQKFIDGLPQVIQSFAESMPRVALAFAFEMPVAAATFGVALIAEAPKIAAAIIKGLGSGAGGAVGSVGKLFKFAEGGQGFVKSVPAGNGNGSSERFPALLGSGELVVDRSTAYKLKNFLDGNSTSTIARPERQAQESSMMDAIMALANRPVEVILDGRVLAKSVRSQVRSGVVLA